MEELKELHDKIKSNPFWLNFDMKYFGSVYNDMYDLEQGILQEFNKKSFGENKKNPQYVMWLSLTHNTNHAMWYICEGFKEMSGEDIMVMQSFLQNMHLLIDGVIPERVIGYTINSEGLQKFTALLNDDGVTYRAVQVLKEDKRGWLIEHNQKMLDMVTNDGFDDMIGYFSKCLSKAKSGEKICGDYIFEE